MISPADLIVYARNQLTPLSKEVAHRSGISRAYYGAYHYCLEAAERWCDEIPPEVVKKLSKPLGSHEKLYLRMEKYCTNHSVSESIRFMAQRAKNLKLERVTADYHLDQDVGPKQITAALNIATQIQDEYKKLSK